FFCFWRYSVRAGYRGALPAILVVLVPTLVKHNKWSTRLMREVTNWQLFHQVAESVTLKSGCSIHCSQSKNKHFGGH
ncbi:MAG TPA: hypothetical protein PKE64_31600, partial [Anaerolineae bacterium]|nr:hypothetical protein [Anaerolineae bacterium]